MPDHYLQFHVLFMYSVFELNVGVTLKINYHYYKVLTPTNTLFIKLDKALKFTLKIILICSCMFRSTTIIREPSLEPS